ncbi:MAG: glycosyltransferase family 2 protein [Candidatus Paceibacterota bacterium]|jgi:glycosyltransferase involved in cell wall biosynthesis
MNETKVSIVLPCRNERESIAACIREIKKVASPISYEIIVSDSSTDGSNIIAKEEGAHIIKHDKEGYGFAIREGVAHANGDIVIFADSDNTYSFTAIPSLLTALESADLVMGSRLQGAVAPHAMPFAHHYFGTPLFNMLLFLFFGLTVSDSQSGFRAIRRTTFQALNLQTNGMEFATEMLIKAQRAKLRIREIPISYGTRKGTSKLRRYHDGFAHLKYILLEAPLVWYATLGLLFLGIGGVGLSETQGGFLNSATIRVLFPILGVQILFFGLFAKTYLAVHFHESNAFIQKLYTHYTLKSALLVSAILILVSLVFKLLEPSLLPFDALLVSTIIGLQIAFNSLTLSTLSIQ